MGVFLNLSQADETRARSRPAVLFLEPRDAHGVQLEGKDRADRHGTKLVCRCHARTVSTGAPFVSQCRREILFQTGAEGTGKRGARDLCADGDGDRRREVDCADHRLDSALGDTKRPKLEFQMLYGIKLREQLSLAWEGYDSRVLVS